MEIVDFAVEHTAIEDLVVLTMKQVTDDRGTVREFYRESAFAEAGLPSLGPWVQVNLTETRRGAIRGMHGESMHKLVAVAAGRAHGAYVDARAGSATFGAVVTLDLEPGVQVLVPPGVCNGFQAVSDPMQYAYCFDVEWQPGMSGVALTPLDPALGIEWPLSVDPDDPALVSAKDRDAPTLADLRASLAG
ncbi:MAG: dTDP-4-dehydrorhamnose 3,5-epimerase [Acidimicrobiales bacterium]|nr:dTDP-4-dehydrorhamnose 3,5-epimerase [Acidimicrobiales bacterium]